jgi:hypothetical protein
MRETKKKEKKWLRHITGNFIFTAVSEAVPDHSFLQEQSFAPTEKPIPKEPALTPSQSPLPSPCKIPSLSSFTLIANQRCLGKRGTPPSDLALLHLATLWVQWTENGHMYRSSAILDKGLKGNASPCVN